MIDLTEFDLAIIEMALAELRNNVDNYSVLAETIDHVGKRVHQKRINVLKEVDNG